MYVSAIDVDARVPSSDAQFGGRLRSSLLLRHVLLFFFACLFFSSQSNAQHSLLKPRVDTNYRQSDHRSILITEFWYPLLQDEFSVIYTDIRFMGDADDNREGNLGIGYRSLTEVSRLGKGVLGLHAWLDRRTTVRNSHFYQTTLGIEWLGDRLDILANGYLPLSFAKTHVDPNANPQGNIFAGTSIQVDVDGTLIEEPQHGFDLELGWQLPWMQGLTDNFRVYGGGYFFDGANTAHLSGWRARLAADLNPDFQVGARFQQDQRGSIAFIETTVRFPFGQKKSFRRRGLRARLDDSPQRDVDIFTAEAVTADGGSVTILNQATGTQQVVLHVDNSVGVGGNGSAENPFNTLAAAEAATQTESIIYVHRGNGTSSGQDLGITLDKSGQQLLGSGTDFLFDPLRMTTATGTLPNSLLVAAATSAPVFTNTAGTGVTITADNVVVAGIAIENATDDGIFINNANQTTVRDVTLNGNGNGTGDDGIYALYSGTGSYSLEISGSTVTNSFEEGLQIETQNLSVLDALIAGNVVSTSGRFGVYQVSRDTSSQTGTLSENTISANSSYGVYLQSLGVSTLTGTLSENTITANSLYGVLLRSENNSTLSGTLSGNTISGNSSHGVYLQSLGVSTLTGTLSENTISANSSSGVYLRSLNESSLSGTVTENTISGNSSYGVYLQSQQNGVLTGMLEGNSITNTLSYGFYAQDTSTQAQTADLGGGSLGSAGNNRIFGSALEEVRVNLAGAKLKAENNWWGDPLGLTLGETLLEGGSTIDADPHLSTSP